MQFSLDESYDENVTCVSVDPSLQVFEFSRYSSFQKVLNVVAWVMKFINNVRPQSVKCSGPLSYEELTKAKVKVFCCVQREEYPQEIRAMAQVKQICKRSPLNKLAPFLNNDGLLRIKGRLENADMSYESKHPIIIPSTHIAKLLVRFQHVFLKHAGVATLMSTLWSGYWVLRL